jgi:hypothetical protein
VEEVSGVVDELPDPQVSWVSPREEKVDLARENQEKLLLGVRGRRMWTHSVQKYRRVAGDARTPPKAFPEHERRVPSPLLVRLEGKPQRIDPALHWTPTIGHRAFAATR